MNENISIFYKLYVFYSFIIRKFLFTPKQSIKYSCHNLAGFVEVYLFARLTM